MRHSLRHLRHVPLLSHVPQMRQTWTPPYRGVPCRMSLSYGMSPGKPYVGGTDPDGLGLEQCLAPTLEGLPDRRGLAARLFLAVADVELLAPFADRGRPRAVGDGRGSRHPFAIGVDRLPQSLQRD